MTDTKRFRDFVDTAGIKYGAIAKAAGLTYQGFLNKLNNDSDFKAGEIKAIAEFAKMPDSTRDAIFFA